MPLANRHKKRLLDSVSGQVGPGFHAIMGEKGSLFGCSEGPCRAWQRRGNAPWPVPPRFELPRPTLGGGGLNSHCMFLQTAAAGALARTPFS